MTETISLGLAKEIAGRYKQLDVDVPMAEYWWKKSIFDYNYCDEAGTTIDKDDGQVLATFIAMAYTATELFSALPVGTTVAKFSDGVWVWGKDAPYTAVFAKGLSECLGLMLCRVLDEQIREKGCAR